MSNGKVSIPFSRRNLEILEKRLPKISGNKDFATLHDTITTKLRGVLHPSYTQEEIRKYVEIFFTDTEEMPKDIGSYHWEKRMKESVRKGGKGGVGAEYFFLDYLMRNSHKNDNYTCLHRKGPHVLDHYVKADMITTVHHHNHIQRTDTFGTQIQYCVLQDQYPTTTKKTLKKEKAVVRGITLEQALINALPEHLRPKIPCLVRLSSDYFLATIPDKEKGEVFESAITSRGTAGYHGGGPTLHLPEGYLKDLINMGYFYQKSCRTFARFLYGLIHENRPTKAIYSTTEHESAYRVNTYDPALGRATYEFYEKTELQKLFLTIIFRVPEYYLGKENI